MTQGMMMSIEATGTDTGTTPPASRSNNFMPPPAVSATPAEPAPADETEPTQGPANQAADNPEVNPDPTEPAGEEPPKGTSDRALQHLQQRQAQDRQKLDSLGSSLDEIKTLLQKSPAPPEPTEGKPTPASAAAEQVTEDATDEVAAALADLESLASDDAGDDLVEAGQLNAAVVKIKSALQALAQRASKPADNPELKTLTERYEALDKQFKEQQSAAQERQATADQAKYWTDFERHHGFAGQDKWQEICEAVASKHENPDVAHAVATDRFASWAEGQKQTATPAPEPPKPTPQRPPGTQPPRSAAGTQTTHSGASTASPSQGVRHGNGVSIAKAPPL